MSVRKMFDPEHIVSLLSRACDKQKKPPMNESGETVTYVDFSLLITNAEVVYD